MTKKQQLAAMEGKHHDKPPPYSRKVAFQTGRLCKYYPKDDEHAQAHCFQCPYNRN